MKSKLGVLFIVLILALTGIGISYAEFSDTISIFGEVTTATTEFEIEGYPYTYIWHISDLDPQWNPIDDQYMDYNIPQETATYTGPSNDILELENQYFYENNIPQCTYLLLTENTAATSTNNAHIHHQFNHLIPSKPFQTSFTIQYTGTIPAKIQNPITLTTGLINNNNFIDPSGSTPPLNWIEYLYHINKITIDTWKAYDTNGDGIYEPDITDPLQADYQLHTNNYIYILITWNIPDEDIYDGCTGEFTTTLDLIQWNNQCEQPQGNEQPAIRLSKTLDGTYTNPQNGQPLTTPTPQIAIDATFPTTFKLLLCVENIGNTDLENILVTDTINSTFIPTQCIPTTGVNWNGHDLTWTIPTLPTGTTKCLEIWLETTLNTQNTYHPTYRCLIATNPKDTTNYQGQVNNYYIENPPNTPFYSIKFETIGEGIKNGETEELEYTLNEDPGSYPLQIQLKGGQYIGTMTLFSVGNHVIDNGFTVEYLSKTLNPDGTCTLRFKITNNNDNALSNVAFEIPCNLPPILYINSGATAAIQNTPCGPLSVQTEEIIIDVTQITQNIGTLNPIPPLTTEVETFCDS